MTDSVPGGVETSRRAVLAGIGATVGGFGSVGWSRAADASPPAAAAETLVLWQGERCVPVRPFSGEQSVEAFYDYRVPSYHASAANGGTDPGQGPYYTSVGTTHLQADGTSVLFLYDGPEGMSLVVVHGSTESGPSGGGSATFAFDGLPADGSWVVRDDYYTDPVSGAIAQSNYDNWDVNGERQVVDWTWANARTDGGAFRGLAGAFPISISPAFNEDAALFGEHYAGTVHSWQLLVPDGDVVTRIPLDVGAPVTIEPGTCDTRAPPPKADAGVEAVEFKGCGEVWFVFEQPFAGTTEVAVETTAGWRSVAVAGSDLQRVPGQFGEAPLVKWRADGAGKILAVETGAGRTDNPHRCARAGRDEGGPDRDDRGRRDEDESDDRGRGDRASDRGAERRNARGDDRDESEDDRGTRGNRGGDEKDDDREADGDDDDDDRDDHDGDDDDRDDDRDDHDGDDDDRDDDGDDDDEDSDDDSED